MNRGEPAFHLSTGVFASPLMDVVHRICGGLGTNPDLLTRRCTHLNQSAGAVPDLPSCDPRSWGRVPIWIGDAGRSPLKCPIPDRWYSQPGHRSDDVGCRISEKNRSPWLKPLSAWLGESHTRGTRQG